MIITLKLDSRTKSSGLNPIFFKLSHGKSGTTEQVRKKIYVGIDVSVKQFDLKNFRAKLLKLKFSSNTLLCVSSTSPLSPIILI